MLQKCCELLDFVILKIADDAREYPNSEKRNHLIGKNNFKKSRAVQEKWRIKEGGLDVTETVTCIDIAKKTWGDSYKKIIQETVKTKHESQGSYFIKKLSITESFEIES